MHLFLIFFNCFYFVSSVFTPHLFFNIINFTLLGFFIFRLLVERKVPRGMLYLAAFVALLLFLHALNYPTVVSLTTSLGVALNLVLAVAAALMVRGSIRVSRPTQRVAACVLGVLLIASLVAEIYFDFTPNDRFYIHRSYSFIHLVIAFLLTIPRSLSFSNVLFLFGIMAYAVLSEGTTGILSGAFLIVSCLLTFTEARGSRRFRMLFIATPVILGGIGAIMNTGDFGVASRLKSNLDSIASIYQGSSEVASTSVIERAEMLNVGMDLLLAHPIMGVGVDNSRYWWQSRFYYGHGGDGGKHLHNSYLELPVSVGVPVSVLLFCFCIYLFRVKRRTISRDYDRIIFIFGSLLLVFMVTNTIYKDIGLIFFLAVFLFVPNYLRSGTRD